MSSFDKYSEYYDLIYKDKDYEAECDFIEQAFKEYSAHTVRTICDGGCGSGGYSEPLAIRGYEVTGIDLSETMVKRAQDKTHTGNPRYLVGDLQDFELKSQYDAFVSMFAVIGYINGNAGLKKTFKNIHRHLKPGGLFICDVWNGLAVMRNLPECRVKEVESEKIKVTRIAIPEMRPEDHVCVVNYKIFIRDKKTGSMEEINEKHYMRFFFPQEIQYMLEDAGFSVKKICPFMELKGAIDEKKWNMSIIAQKK